MKAQVGLLICTLALLLSGCSSLKVNSEFDPMADFSSFRAYKWVAGFTTVEDNAQSRRVDESMLDQQIRRAIDNQLVANGLRLDEQAPDLLVVYYLGVQDQVDVTDWGYSASQQGDRQREVDAYEYREGTLTIDLVDADTKVLVWRGKAQDAVEEKERTPEEIEKRVNSVVAKIFEEYPPKG